MKWFSKKGSSQNYINKLILGHNLALDMSIIMLSTYSKDTITKYLVSWKELMKANFDTIAPQFIDNYVADIYNRVLIVKDGSFNEQTQTIGTC